MPTRVPEEFALIAGRGVYPCLLAESARRQGVRRIVAIAFSHETDRAIAKHCDEVHWMPVGKLGQMLDTLRASGMRHAVMVGLITPTHLFRVRPDAQAFALLKRLDHRNAHTIFGAVVDELARIGIEVLPAYLFMDSHLPVAGQLSARGPTPSEARDIALGLKVAEMTSGLDIGQTVVIKEGTILAVEAFEGTDATILRAAELGGPGVVVVKVAKHGHDRRFDIPVVGLGTLKILKKVRAAALALQAGRAIVLEQDKVVKAATEMNLCLQVVPARPLTDEEERP